MNRKVLFFVLAACTGLASCSTYSGPQYNVQAENDKQNGGEYDEATYKDDISMLDFKLDLNPRSGTTPHKTTRTLVDGKEVVTFSYEFLNDGVRFIYYITLPDYQGVRKYGFTESYPATMVFNKVKEKDDEVIDQFWRSANASVEVTYADEKYVEAKFEGDFVIVNAAGDPQGTALVTSGTIRAQWQR